MIPITCWWIHQAWFGSLQRWPTWGPPIQGIFTHCLRLEAWYCVDVIGGSFCCTYYWNTLPMWNVIRVKQAKLDWTRLKIQQQYKYTDWMMTFRETMVRIHTQHEAFTWAWLVFWYIRNGLHINFVLLLHYYIINNNLRGRWLRYLRGCWVTELIRSGQQGNRSGQRSIHLGILRGFSLQCCRGWKRKEQSTCTPLRGSHVTYIRMYITHTCLAACFRDWDNPTQRENPMIIIHACTTRVV